MTSSMPDVATPASHLEDAPVLELRFVGDGRAFVRALARIIVRHELISAGLIANPDACVLDARAG